MFGRLASVAMVVALLATSCAGVSVETEASVELAEASAASEVSEVSDGRIALAENQGKPHVLWFWGAN